MIRFDLASAMPKNLNASDLRRLGALLGKSFRWRETREVGLRFVSPKEMQRLNRDYHGCDRPTDVLSFESAIKNYLGDIAICPDFAVKEAKRRSIAAHEELLRLLVHGVLHLKGMDHRTASEEQKMFSLQERLLSHFLVQSL
jgi:probable rRNA maturation factor